MKKKQNQMMSRLAELNQQTEKQIKKKHLTPLYFQEEEVKSHQPDTLEKIQQISLQIAKSNFFLYFNLCMIVISCIVIIIDHHEISDSELQILQIIDFICMVYFFIELIINVWGRGYQEYFREFINIFDASIIWSQLILIIDLFFADESIVVNDGRYINFVKAFKIMRLMIFLYVARIFYTISVLSRCLVETIIKIRDMILLFVILALVLGLFGQELLAYKALFIRNEEGEIIPASKDLEDYVSQNINFETFGNSIMAAINIYYNEEWSVTMYSYGQATYVAIVYYVLGILFGQVLFVRLLTAVFLNEFCKQLNQIGLDLKPIDFSQFFQRIKKFLKGLSKMRESTRIHNQSSIQERTPKDNKLTKIIRPSMMNHNLQRAMQEDNHNKFQIVSPKDSMMMDPLRHDYDTPLQNQQNNPQQQENKANRQNQANKDGQDEIQDMNDDIIDYPDNDEMKETEHHVNIHRRGNNRVEKTFFVFTPESTIRITVTKLVSTNYFRAFNFILILLTSLRIALLNPTEDPNSNLSQTLHNGYIILTVLYILIILLNCIAFGMYSGEKSYFQQSVYNIFTFLITILDLCTLIFNIRNPINKFITSLRILQFIQIGAEVSRDIGYAQTSLLNAFFKMIQLTIFCFIILSMFGMLAVKLLKGSFYYCSCIDAELQEFITNSIDCLDYGGCWVNQIMNFDNVVQSVLYLFVIATTENWMPLMVSTWSAVAPLKQPILDYNRYWAIYFQLFFFIGNLCMLNMFIGLIVNAFQEAKMKAQNLHLLDETQREWFQIKMSIYNMRPLVKSKKPTNLFRQYLFFMVKDKRFKILWLIIIFLNTIILCIYYQRQDENFKLALDTINSIFVYTQLVEIVCRFFAKDLKMYFKDTPNIIDIFAIWFCVANLYIRNDSQINSNLRRIFNAISVGFQIIRNFRIIKRFNDLEKLFSSILSVIPSALSMMFIMLIFLFIFTTLGIDMFAYLRTQQYIDGYNLHFRNFTSAMFSLVRVASAEFWWALLVDSAHTQEPNFACIYMDGYDDFVKYGYNGCGTSYAYLFYISFHLIFSLMILNLFIASILGAYEEHVKQEESAISKYQLNDVLTLWRNYDDQGEGFINYKLFWKLSSEIAIIFGVDQADLLDVNNKKNFLKVLNIPIYESKKDQILCYKFHDVILSLTKISVTLKYGVTNLEPTDKIIQQKLQQQYGEQQQYNSKLFTTTSFNSGDMVAIITIQKKFRLWKRRIQIKKEGGDVNQIYNDMSDFKNMIKKQIQLEEEQERQKLGK